MTRIAFNKKKIIEFINSILLDSSFIMLNWKIKQI